MCTIRSFRKMVFLALAFTLTLAGGAAFAVDDSETFELTVRHGDLDLYSAEGARKLYYRLSRATKDACNVGRGEKIGSFRFAREARQCYLDTLQSALSQLDSEVLALMKPGAAEEREMISKLVANRQTPRAADSDS